MKPIATLVLALLSVMAADANRHNCYNPHRLTYRVDLYSFSTINHQTSRVQTLYVPRCQCMLWNRDFWAITYNVEFVNTWGKQFCVHRGDSCRGYYEYVYSGRTDGTYGKRLSNQLKGLVYSSKYCDNWSKNKKKKPKIFSINGWRILNKIWFWKYKTKYCLLLIYRYNYN